MRTMLAGQGLKGKMWFFSNHVENFSVETSQISVFDVEALLTHNRLLINHEIPDWEQFEFYFQEEKEFDDLLDENNAVALSMYRNTDYLLLKGAKENEENNFIDIFIQLDLP